MPPPTNLQVLDHVYRIFEISSTQLTKLIKSQLFGVRWECSVLKNNLLGGHFRIKYVDLHLMLLYSHGKKGTHPYNISPMKMRSL